MSLDLRQIRTIHDVQAIEVTPWRERCHVESTYELIGQAAKTNPEGTAIDFIPKGDGVETPVRQTYDEFFGHITQAANLFNSLGVGSSDVVSYILPNLPETHEIIWGAEAAGIVNALNPLLDIQAIKKLLMAAKSKLLVITAPEGSLESFVSLSHIVDEVDSLAALIVVDPTVYHGREPAMLPSHTKGGVPILRYREERNKQSPDQLESKRVFDPTDIASIFHTGGTTGVPKLAPHTHENEVFIASLGISILGLGPSDRFFVGMPLFHVNAVILTGLCVFASGGSVLLATSAGYRSPSVVPCFWKIVETYGITHMSGVPTIYGALMQQPINDIDISTLKVAVCGAAPLSSDAYIRFKETTGIELLEGYGLTEGTVMSTMNPLYGERRVGSIGIRIPYQDVQIADINENGQRIGVCDLNEVGSILIKGPNVFQGYLGMEEKDFVDNEWFNSGDLGRIDQEGYIWLTGRSKDLIIRSGHNIDPAIIENTLAGHPSVANVAAVGQPDAYAGEMPCAYVDLEDGAITNNEELRLWAREHITEKGAAPAYVEIMDGLPLTAVGKIYKPILRRMAIKRVISECFESEGIQASFEVVDQKKAGFLISIQAEDKNAVQNALSGFTIPFEFR